MSRTERIIAISSGTVTLLNFLFAMPPLLTASVIRPHSIFQNMTFSSRVVLLVIVETLLAYAFGIIIGLAAKIDNPLTYAIYIVVSMVSAWVSIFNVQYFLVFNSVGPNNIPAIFIIGCVGACFLAILLGAIHINNAVTSFIDEGLLGGFLFIQAGSFLLVALAIANRPG